VVGLQDGCVRPASAHLLLLLSLMLMLAKTSASIYSYKMSLSFSPHSCFSFKAVPTNSRKASTNLQKKG
jgi:hypothetical protein